MAGRGDFEKYVGQELRKAYIPHIICRGLARLRPLQHHEALSDLDKLSPYKWRRGWANESATNTAWKSRLSESRTKLAWVKPSGSDLSNGARSFQPWATPWVDNAIKTIAPKGHKYLKIKTIPQLFIVGKLKTSAINTHIFHVPWNKQ